MSERKKIRSKEIRIKKRKLIKRKRILISKNKKVRMFIKKN